MYRKALLSLTVLFFMMGFITCLNDILVPYLKQIFELSYMQASLIQFCFFGAYGLTSIPASKIIEKVGYQRGMVLGFIVTAVGCLLFFPAVSFHKYSLFLGALFVLATGVVLLQVAANPFVSVLGPPATASARLTMTQAFNSFGTFVAPFFGSILILSTLDNSMNSEAVKYPYLFIAVVLVVIAVILGRMKFPEIPKTAGDEEGAWGSVFKEPNLLLGMLGIFTYVGAEVAIGSFLVNYVMENVAMVETEAANYIAFYWGGAMVGRFLGIYTLKLFSPGKVLCFHSLLAIAFIVLSINSSGMLAVYSMIAVGLCNSIMFPTIFTLAIKGLEKSAEKASGLLATAILGGAIIPLFTGWMADTNGLRLAFILPMVCYAYIAFYGFKARK
ncbi:MAG: sugar MFS transporter [Bdellovibrionales bacterium]|nr:sugar MFS transporter [Bdellovibrionales bacterium]